jgi:hypothetical protein
VSGALVAGLVAFVAYWLTLAPSITWRNGGADSGDIVTAAAVLGVPHPPGYPFFTLVAHLAVVALPGVEPARAVGLLSALLAAAAAAVLALAGTELCRQAAGIGAAPGMPSPLGVVVIEGRGAQLAGAVVSLTLALGPLWWHQADLPTAHAANLLFAALFTRSAVGLIGGEPRRSAAAWTLAGLVAGLAVSHHLTLLALPAALVGGAAIAGARPDPRALVGGAIGLAPWLLLPAVAARHPPHSWGDPTTLGGFAKLVNGRGYWELLAAPTPGDVLARFAVAVRLLAGELGPLALALALIGVAVLWGRFAPYLTFAAGVAAADAAFFAVYPARDVESYLLPAAVALGPLAAVGLAVVLGEAGARARRPAWVLAAVPPLAALALNWSGADLSADTQAIDYARGVLAAAPGRGVLVSDDDRPTFALWYASTALGLRPDVAVLDTRFMRLDWYSRLLARRYPDHAPAVDEVTGLAESGRPVVTAPPTPR